ncbi:MAG TPA: ATP-binding protein [Candidatus Binatia bacterium]|jgi:PAS domain S-box-containing protein
MATPDNDFRDLLANAFDCFPLAVVIVGLDGRFLHANPSACHLLATSPDALRRQRIAEFFLPEQRSALSDLAEAILDRDLDNFHEERSLVRHDGKTLDLDITGAVLRTAGGKPGAVLALGREVAQARAADSFEPLLGMFNVDRLSREESGPEGAALREEFESLCRSVSQQFRIPLRIIEGYSDIVLEDCAAGLDDVALRYLHTIRDQSHRLSALIDNTLALARISSRPLHRENLDLSAAALDAAAVVRAESHAHEVEVEVQPGLVVDADANLTGRLLRRLFDNAFRFSRCADHPRVEFGCDCNAAGSTFFVRDNGAGFEPALAEQLFLPFETSRETSELAGAGVGLAEVQRIVARHGGKVWAEGVPGNGATFYFTLPAAPVPVPKP